MSHEEKQNYLSLLSTLAISIPYILFVLNKYQSESPTGTEELKFWASAVLLMVPLRIAAFILFYIVASIIQAIVTGKDPEKAIITDERDKLIEMKGAVGGFYSFCFGFLIAMGALLQNPKISVMFIVLMISGLVSEIISILLKIYFYNKGL